MSNLFPEIGEYLHATFPELADELGIPKPEPKEPKEASMRQGRINEQPEKQAELREPVLGNRLEQGLSYLREQTPLGSIGQAVHDVADVVGTPMENAGMPGVEQAMTVFHGSPYRGITKFVREKVGAGEGAAAYGHGMPYLAENPAVAREYAKGGMTPVFSVKNPVTGAWMEVNRAEHDSLAHAAAVIYDAGKSEAKRIFSEAVQKAKEIGWEKAGAPRAGYYEDVLGYINNLSKSDIKRKFSSSLYTVDLPDEHIDKMLDWDKPLNEQSEYVKNALDQSGLSDMRGRYTDAIYERAQAQAHFDSLRANYKMGKPGTKERQDYLEAAGKIDSLSDELRALENKFRFHETGEQIYKKLAKINGGKSELSDEAYRATSEQLRSLGIPGIKYLDQGSRVSGKGTHNFVMFDPDLVKILKEE